MNRDPVVALENELREEFGYDGFKDDFYQFNYDNVSELAEDFYYQQSMAGSPDQAGKGLRWILDTYASIHDMPSKLFNRLVPEGRIEEPVWHKEHGDISTIEDFRRDLRTINSILEEVQRDDEYLRRNGHAALG